MCQAVDEALQESRMIGLQEGKIETMINNIQMIMNTLHVDSDEAMNILNIPINEREIYKS